ncbi:hypothetical protein D030_4384A, partial [Vibrio parahaemolyticus AQ3810]|jgi:adenylate kinase
MEAR